MICQQLSHNAAHNRKGVQHVCPGENCNTCRVLTAVIQKLAHDNDQPEDVTARGMVADLPAQQVRPRHTPATCPLPPTPHRSAHGMQHLVSPDHPSAPDEANALPAGQHAHHSGSS